MRSETGGVVAEQRLVDLVGPRLQGGVSDQLAAHFHKGSHHIDAHRDGPLTVQNCGCHERAVLGEDQGQVFPVLPATGF